MSSSKRKSITVIEQSPVSARFRWRARLAFYFQGNWNGFTFTGRHRELYSYWSGGVKHKINTSVVCLFYFSVLIISKVCQEGACTASLCIKYGFESCQLTAETLNLNKTHSIKEKLCDLACINPDNGYCTHINHLNIQNNTPDYSNVGQGGIVRINGNLTYTIIDETFTGSN